MTVPLESIDTIDKHHFVEVTRLEVFDVDDYQEGHTITGWCGHLF